MLWMWWNRPSEARLPRARVFRCHQRGHQARYCTGDGGITAEEKLASLKRAVDRLEEKKRQSIATLKRNAEREKRKEEQRQGREADLQKAEEQKRELELVAGIKLRERERLRAERKLREEMTS